MPPKAVVARTIERVTAWALTLRPVRALLHYTEHRGPVLADSITYRALFSVFAGVLLGFSVAALWLAGNPAAWQALVDTVDNALPGIAEVVDFSEITAPAGVTVAGALSLLGLVGAALGAIGALRAALRALADRLHDDSFWLWVILRNLLLALAVGGGLALAAAATFFGGVAIEALTEPLGWGEGTRLLTRLLTMVVVLALNSALIALLFASLSGVRASARTLWTGALLGGIGLLALQELSGLFVGGATANPLLTTFASLIALLLWINLSAQVILIAASYIVVATAEESDRVRERHGADTLAKRRVKQAERAVSVATEELRAAREAEEAARGGD